jgi:hypothetical protein
MNLSLLVKIIDYFQMLLKILLKILFLIIYEKFFILNFLFINE